MPLSTLPTLPPEFGGYRLVRIIDRQPFVTVALVHSEGQARLARVFDDDAPEALIENELAVHDLLSTAPAELRNHVVRLDDLLTLPDDRLVLLVEPVVGPSLDHVLTEREGRLQPGEVVTMLAPIMTAVARGHDRGLTGLGIAAETVRLDATGAPVIVDLDHARVGPPLPDRFRASDPAMTADRQALAALINRMVEALHPDHGTSLAAAVGLTDLVVPVPATGGAGVEKLFEWAMPLPLDVHTFESRRSGHQVSTVTPARETAPIDPHGDVRGYPHESPHGNSHGKSHGNDSSRASSLTLAVADTLRRFGMPETVRNIVERVLQRTAELGATRLSSSAMSRRARDLVHAVRAPKRPRLVVTAVAGLSALLLALALAALPSERSVDGTSPERATAEQSLRDATSLEEATPEAVPATDADGGLAVSADGAVPHRPSPEQWSAIVHELVRDFTACRLVTEIAPQSTEDRRCAQSVVYPGSAAEFLLARDDPRHENLARWSEEDGEVVIAENMGGAVLVDLVQPVDRMTTASLLLFKSEAGWRIRDVIP